MATPIRYGRAQVAAAVVLSGLVAGCTAPQPERPGSPNVLLIVVDTLRQDRVGCYGAERDTSPAMDALAARSVRFERAYSTAPWTIPSVGSMITGSYPSRHTATTFAHELPDEVTTLAELLGEAGYETSGVVSHSAIGTKHNFQQGYDVFMESEAQGHGHVSTDGVTRQAIERLEAHAASEAPFLLFVHYFDPHFNYIRHPEYDFAAPSQGRLTGAEKMKRLHRLEKTMTPEEALFLRDLYDGEIRYTDAGIERLLDRLDELGLGEETIVVLTADHGEEFLDHKGLGHTTTVYEELVRVPLLIRAPGLTQAGAVVSRPVSLVSLTPTILEMLGLETGGSSFQGESIVPLLTGADEPGHEMVFVEVDYVAVESDRPIKEFRFKAVVGERYKLIRNDLTSGLELYDLREDPKESAPLEASRPELAAELLTSLERAVAFARAGALEPETRQIDDEELERLKGLGYVGQ